MEGETQHRGMTHRTFPMDSSPAELSERRSGGSSQVVQEANGLLENHMEGLPPWHRCCRVRRLTEPPVAVLSSRSARRAAARVLHASGLNMWPESVRVPAGWSSALTRIGATLPSAGRSMATSTLTNFSKRQHSSSMHPAAAATYSSSTHINQSSQCVAACWFKWAIPATLPIISSRNRCCCGSPACRPRCVLVFCERAKHLHATRDPRRAIISPCFALKRHNATCTGKAKHFGENGARAYPRRHRVLALERHAAHLPEPLRPRLHAVGPAGAAPAARPRVRPARRPLPAPRREVHEPLPVALPDDEPLGRQVAQHEQRVQRGEGEERAHVAEDAEEEEVEPRLVHPQCGLAARQWRIAVRGANAARSGKGLVLAAGRHESFAGQRGARLGKSRRWSCSPLAMARRAEEAQAQSRKPAKYAWFPLREFRK